MKWKEITKKELWTKELVAWYLYDFANSVFVLSGSLYFSQWVVADKGLTDFWFGFPFIAATALLIFISPYVGEVGDRKGSHQKILTWFTIAAFVASVGIIISAKLTASLKGVILALIFYGLFNFLYQLALVPYGVFMKLNSRTENYGRISGIGYAFNQLGYFVGIIVTFPAVRSLFGLSGTDRITALIPALVVFILCAMPAFFLLKSKARSEESHISVFGSLKRSLKDSRNRPGLFRFLISFYLFSDAILSISLYAAIYLQNVFKVSDTVKGEAFLFVIVADVMGAFLAGLLSDKVGHKKVLFYSLGLNVIAIAGVALSNNITTALIMFPVFGFAMGGAYTSSRSYFASLFSDEESGKFFGLYAFSERFASVMGPIIWGGIVYLLRNSFPWNYRMAALSMAFIVALSLLVLTPFNKKRDVV